jgi:chromosome segregation ATPase
MAVKENIVIDVTVDTGDATNTIDGIENRIEELIAQRNELQIGTKEFEKVSREIQGLQTDIKNVELQFESLDFEQKLTAGMDAVTGLAGGFVAAEGAMLLFNSESEQLEEVLRRVGGALALTSGLRDLANGVIALRKFGLAAKLATARQIALNVAMSANPIGLIVLALAALTAGVLAYAAATREVSDEERLATIRREQLIDATKEARKNIAEEKVELESLLRIARDKNASDKARAEAVKQLNELSPEYLGALTTENVLTEEGTKLVDKYVEALEKRALAEAMQTKLVELQKEKIDNQFKSIDELVGAQDLEKLSLMALIDADKAREERRKIAIENLNEQNKAIDEQISVLTNQLATSKEDELQTDANTRAYEANAAATKKAKTEKELLIEQMEKESLELEKLTISSREEALNKYQELLAIETEATRTAATEEAAVEQERFDFLSAMGTAFVDGEIARIEEVREAAKRADEERQANLDKAQQGIEFLGLVNQAFVKDEEKREKIRKALALAQIAVDTARGISAAVAAGAGVPFPGNIPAIIAGVSAVLAGVIQAKQVIGSAGNTPSVDSAISGASAGGGGVPLNNISNTASLVDQQQQEITTQVVVLESDITTTQENVTTVSELSSF